MPDRAVRVVVVDDSPTVREMLTTLLQSAPDIDVVGTGANGEDAVRLAQRLRPDVITLDIRMPRLDGLEATRRIMHERPTPIVIISGSLMRGDVDLSLEALRSGALTVLKKPGLNDPETCENVVNTVRLMAQVPVVRRWRSPAEPLTGGPAKTDRREARPPRPVIKRDIRVVGIASSTGGPAALAAILRELPAQYPLPILIVQHVTIGFTAGLAEWLAQQTPLRVTIAGHGEALQPGTVMIAPDDYHLQINAHDIIELSRQAAYRGLRPSANFLFHSLARAYGRQAAGFILTGMGDDGVDGLEALHQAGGLTIGQDEETCVVYGMPCEAARRQALDYVLPLEHMAVALYQVAHLEPGLVRHE